MSRATVLIVEGRAFSRFLLRRALEELGLDVLGVRSEVEALQFMSLGGDSTVRTPDVVVIGDMSGRRDGAYRIVALPNARARNRRARLSGLSKAQLVPTPVSPGRLSELVLRLVEGEVQTGLVGDQDLHLLPIGEAA